MEDIFDVKNYDYFLPSELIANKIKFPRDNSRLMLVDVKNKTIGHSSFFSDLKKYIDKNFVIVRNNSRVFPARIMVLKKGKDSVTEMLFLKVAGKTTWEVMVKNAKRARIGDVYVFRWSDKSYELTIKDLKERGIRIVDVGMESEVFLDILEKAGLIPLPPYIEKDKTSDYKTDYQTVYAKSTGSVAAPTAGFHFTEDLMAKMQERGVIFEDITLHVGMGTFLPVKTDDLRDHKMHAESIFIEEAAVERLNRYKREGKKILAVGTTTLRCLESLTGKDGGLKYYSDGVETEIFIYPGYKFKFVDALITNFHLPKSTLLMLVAAFLADKGKFDNKEKAVAWLMNIYDEAIREKYRFYSFGDAMLIR